VWLRWDATPFLHHLHLPQLSRELRPFTAGWPELLKIPACKLYLNPGYSVSVRRAANLWAPVPLCYWRFTNAPFMFFSQMRTGRLRELCGSRWLFVLVWWPSWWPISIAVSRELQPDVIMRVTWFGIITIAPDTCGIRWAQSNVSVPLTYIGLYKFIRFKIQTYIQEATGGLDFGGHNGHVCESSCRLDI